MRRMGTRIARQQVRRAGILLAAVVLLVACGEKGTDKLTSEAVQQLGEISEVDLPALEQEDMMEPEFISMFQRVVERYRRSGDMTAGRQRGEPDILQLACLFKKAELVRNLLEQGADPNEHAPDDESPLLSAVNTYLLPETTVEQIIPLVDMLLARGAEFRKSGTMEGDFLTRVAFVCEREEVLLYLLDKGAQPDEETTLPPALHGWAKVLERLLDLSGKNTAGLLHAVAVGSCQFEGDHVRCVHILLEAGADIHAPEAPNMPGSTALFRMAAEMSALDEGDPHLPHAIEVFSCLVREGADPYLRADADENYPGFCPYDFLAQRPRLLTELRERGIDLQAPALRIDGGKNLLADICRASVYKPEGKVIAPFFEAIAGVLKPTPEMLSAEIYTQALEAGVRLLGKIDPSRAAQRIMEMPLWREAEGVKKSENILIPLLAALQDTPRIKFPADFLYRQAERAQKTGLKEEAALLIELMERSEDGEELLRQCMEDSRLPLCAGAYAARLRIDGLPDARNDGVSAWLKEHGREADTDFLKEAKLLTSPERLWFGNMNEADIRKLVVAMRRIGAPHAADAYEQIAVALNDPEKLDAIMEKGDDWKYEAEIAIARYFLKNKTQFFHPHDL